MKKHNSNKMIWRFLFSGNVILLLFLHSSIFAQFAPPAGQEGSTAIDADSNIFVAWANNCEINRGLMDISNPDLGFAWYGESESAIGKADNDVVSLGDGGSAIIYFETPIVNAEGFDFAVFENAFLDEFLELAFVEVSTDGLNYQRISNTSNTQNTEQIETFGVLNATQINNLAGKYRQGYGTPFDLSDLESTDNIDLQKIHYIKIIDVIGSIDEDYATYDSQGDIINDPWPTPFETSGFDLDAIGIIHDLEHLGVDNSSHETVAIYPNPFKDYISLSNIEIESKILFYDLNSNLLLSKIAKKHDLRIEISDFPKGIIIIKIVGQDSIYTKKLFHN